MQFFIAQFNIFNYNLNILEKVSQNSTILRELSQYLAC